MVSAETAGNVMQLKQLCTVVFLAGNSRKDLKTGEISLSLAAVYGMGGILCSILEGREALDWLVPLGVGILFLALAFLTEGGVGAGDGFVLLALGSQICAEDFIRAVCLGMILAAFWAGILMTVFRKGRKTEIPWIPFLFAGYVGGVLL